MRFLGIALLVAGGVWTLHLVAATWLASRPVQRLLDPDGPGNLMALGCLWAFAITVVAAGLHLIGVGR